MKKAEIRVGGHYLAMVSGRLVTVRVDRISPRFTGGGREYLAYEVTNLATGRRTVFRSAAKFRGEAPQVADPSPTPAAATTSSTHPARPAPAAAAPSPNGSEPNTAPTRLERLGRQLEASRTEAAPHLIVEARAGTGKTTTLIEGLKKVLGVPSDHPAARNPDPQQRAVWEAMGRGPRPGTVCFVAFNKSIATELQGRVPRGCEAMTMHSLGYRAVTRALGRQEPNSYVVQDLIAELLETDLRELRKIKPTVLKATEDLVSLCKMNLVGIECEGEYGSTGRSWTGRSSHTPEEFDKELDRLATHYDIDLNGSRREVYDLVPQVLDRCREPKGKINFDDMIWLPLVLNLPVFSYDLLLVDEAQDLNQCQQALAKKAGKRLILCGDPKQAIYGFAGADAESLTRMNRELGSSGCCGGNNEVLCEHGRGCILLPLTVTRRCGKAIVAEARKTVPDFEAHPSNPEGLVTRSSFKGSPAGAAGHGTSQEVHCYRNSVQDGDFILCRCNAPLVSECFRLLKAGRKANIQGRDVGQGLISLVKKLCYPKEKECPLEVPVTHLIAALDNWLAAEEAKERAKRQPSAAKLAALQDRHDCLLCFAGGTRFVDEVVRKVETVFTDDKHRPGIRLSSIHKAKGLEARRVFLLLGDGEKSFGPPPDKLQPWEQEQERNLRYVAITRAIEELVYVS